MTTVFAHSGATVRLILALLFCTSVTAVLTAAGTARARPSVAGLTAARDGGPRTTVWMVFRAPDCGLSAELIERLNQIDRSRRVQVIGVMLFPPGDSTGQAALTKSLGMRFEVVADDRGVWRAALQRERQREPVLYVRDGTSLLGGVSPDLIRQLDALSLSGVPMERER